MSVKISTDVAEGPTSLGFTSVYSEVSGWRWAVGGAGWGSGGERRNAKGFTDGMQKRGGGGFIDAAPGGASLSRCNCQTQIYMNVSGG